MKKIQSIKARLASIRNLEINENRQRSFWIAVGGLVAIIGFLIGRIA